MDKLLSFINHIPEDEMIKAVEAALTAIEWSQSLSCYTYSWHPTPDMRLAIEWRDNGGRIWGCAACALQLGKWKIIWLETEDSGRVHIVVELFQPDHDIWSELIDHADASLPGTLLSIDGVSVEDL